MQFDFAKVDTGATAWVLASSALVLIMTPGVAFLYGGMVRAKNVLSTMMQSYVVMALVGVIWVVCSYSLAFGKGNAFIGDLHFAGLTHMDEVVPGFTGDAAQVIPPLVYRPDGRGLHDLAARSAVVTLDTYRALVGKAPASRE